MKLARTPRTRPIAALALAALASGCTTTGQFEGQLNEAAQPTQPESPGAPEPRHEKVEFSWSSPDAGQSGTITAMLPTGERFVGQFHQITTETSVTRLGDFYGGWRGGVWGRGDWAWGPAWTYTDSYDDFIVMYTGTVLALLTSPDRNMRCRFELNNPSGGMDEGGLGDCQLSDGGRITAWFAGEHDEPLS